MGTAEQMRTGRTWKRLSAEFGERVWFFPVAVLAAREDAGARRMIEGVFVGHHTRRGATLCLTPQGVMRGTRFQKQTGDRSLLGDATMNSLRVAGGRLAVQTEGRARVATEVSVAPPVLLVERPPIERRMCILRQVVDQYKPTRRATPGCQACAEIDAGSSKISQKHIKACRARMTRLMEADDDEAVRNCLAHNRLKRDSRAGSAAEASEPGAGSTAQASDPRAGSTGEDRGTKRKRRIGWCHRCGVYALKSKSSGGARRIK
eukprot:2523719-Amphidinium_carterae.1